MPQMPATTPPYMHVTARQEDEAEAFRDLYDRFFPRLLRYCHRICHGSAEDVAQETMARALEHLQRLDTSHSLWPWLKTIALNLAIDETRKRRRITTLEDHLEDVPDISDRAEERLILVDALRGLTEGQRTAVLLSYVQGRASHEVAAALQLSPAAFKQLLFRARKRLRLEYARLSDAAEGILVGTGRLLREAAQSVGSNAQRVATMANPEALDRLSAGLVAVVLVLLGGPEALDPGPPDVALAAEPEQARSMEPRPRIGVTLQSYSPALPPIEGDERSAAGADEADPPADPPHAGGPRSGGGSPGADPPAQAQAPAAEPPNTKAQVGGPDLTEHIRIRLPD